jgi:hypothetical protein
MKRKFSRKKPCEKNINNNIETKKASSICTVVLDDIKEPAPSNDEDQTDEKTFEPELVEYIENIPVENFNDFVMI